MKELKTIKEIENHIYELEKQVFQLKNTHAFRVGMSIMNFYNQPNKAKILGIHHFLNDLLAGTKKKSNLNSNFISQTKITLNHNVLIQNPSLKVDRIKPQISNQYYFIPYFKGEVNILTLEESCEGYYQLTPNNFNNVLQVGNFNEIQLDVGLLVKLNNWRNFGTYDDIQRTNTFLDLLKSNQDIKKTLIHSGNIILFPLLLDNIEIFDEVVVTGGDNR
ncbi:hypothetical protein EC844_10583 [Acinetobacter calcoaceticus]|uniref:Uncharacterized protein n=1 Tax=Acinetobacter calcoaceticus TaxID=471 RepID=A0A4R1Y086_ACICA|nr:hypothetical protein EC844_10583 [Acinetobacter calcoaceticus]